MFYKAAFRFVFTALLEALLGLLALPFYFLARKPLKEKPEFFYVESDTNNAIAEEIPALAAYTPSPWCLGPHAQTFFGMLKFGKNPQYVEREIVVMPDNVGIILDWYADASLPDDAPIVVTLHGIGGDELAVRPIMVAEHMLQSKWGRCCCFIRRGHGSSSLIPLDSQNGTPALQTGQQTPVTAPKAADGQLDPAADAATSPGQGSANGGTAHATPGKPAVKAFPMHADVDDLANVLEHCRAKYPKAPILAVGFSMGSNVLVKYLGQFGSSPRNPLLAAASVANGYDIVEGTQKLASGRKLSDRMVTIALQRLFRRRLDEIRHLTMTHGMRVDLDEVLASRTIRHFDQALMLPLYGYKDLDDYYHDNNCRPYFKDVSVPLLCLSARDDPIIHHDLLRHAVEAAHTNPNIFLAVTQRGGHLGWMEGWSGQPWSMEVFMQFMKLMVDRARAGKLAPLQQRLAQAQAQAQTPAAQPLYQYPLQPSLSGQATQPLQPVPTSSASLSTSVQAHVRGGASLSAQTGGAGSSGRTTSRTSRNSGRSGSVAMGGGSADGDDDDGAEVTSQLLSPEDVNVVMVTASAAVLGPSSGSASRGSRGRMSGSPAAAASAATTTTTTTHG